MIKVKQAIENFLVAGVFLVFILFSAFGVRVVTDRDGRDLGDNLQVKIDNTASVGSIIDGLDQEVLSEVERVNKGERDVVEKGEVLFPFAKVTRVVDGDTIKVVTDISTTLTVRMIGINTPETVDPRRKVECYGKEASQKAKDLLTDQIVRLDIDPTQQKFDKYNRLLAYVYLVDKSDGKDLFFNKYMIENGFAYEYTYGTPYVFQKEFKEAEQAARDAGRGLWGNSLTTGSGCN
jgi:micrococcal nuclease